MILETQRLYLKELTHDDAYNFYALNLDKNVLQYTGDIAFKNEKEAHNFLSNYDHYKKYGFGRWAVVRKLDNEFLGWCGLKNNPEKKETDIGFRFFKKYWNKGYATESAGACIKYGFNTLHLSKIVGRAMLENQASVKVLEKIGLKFSHNFDFDGNKGVFYQIEDLPQIQ